MFSERRGGPTQSVDANKKQDESSRKSGLADWLRRRLAQVLIPVAFDWRPSEQKIEHGEQVEITGMKPEEKPQFSIPFPDVSTRYVPHEQMNPNMISDKYWTRMNESMQRRLEEHQAQSDEAQRRRVVKVVQAAEQKVREIR